MVIGQPRIGQTRWGQGRFQPVTLIGTDRRIPSRPAVICTAPTGRTHDCKLPITHRASKKSLQARGRPHMSPVSELCCRIKVNCSESALAALRLHDNVDLTTKFGQHPHDALDGYVAKLALQHPGQIGLTHPGNPCRLRLIELTVAHSVLYAAHKLRFEQMRIGIGKTQIDKNIFCPAPDSRIAFLGHRKLLLRA